MDILVIKTAALGDVLRTSFIAQALKNKYKKNNPVLFWITNKIAMPLFSNNPYVDHLIFEGNKDSLQRVKFDLIINLEEGKDLVKFASELKSNKVIGFKYENNDIVPTKTLKEWFNMSGLGESPRNDVLKKNNLKTHRQIIGEIVGVDWEKYEPFIRLKPFQRKIASNFLKRYNLSKSDLIIGLNTGAADTWPKSLPVKTTAKLIDELYKKYNATILLFGGPGEVKRNKEIQKLSKAPIIDTGCGNDLLEFPALISVCSTIITTDSLGLHMALALKRKTIALIGPTSSSEIGMYGLGEKVVSSSKEACTYSQSTNKCMEKISISQIIGAFNKILPSKITLLITSFKEPETGKAIEAALNQKSVYPYDILVSAPDKETLDIAKSYAKKHKNITVIQDPGKGKSFALNLIFKKLKTDILILTDGDVVVGNQAIEEITNSFLDPQIGCVTGRPVPTEDKSTRYGYWANFLFDMAHKWRKNSFNKKEFIECSGYLFAFRKNQVKKIPLDVAEDAVIPYFFWEKGYQIGYVPQAEVFVKNPNNLQDWLDQKTRTSKAHETLKKYVDTKTTKRVKSFGSEAKGIVNLFTYPKNLKEVYWSLQLVFLRLYMWYLVFYHTCIKNQHYGDAWKRIESTK